MFCAKLKFIYMGMATLGQLQTTKKEIICLQKDSSRLTIVFFFFTILLVQRTPQEAFRTYAFLASSTPPKIVSIKIPVIW